jgi:lipopolysaccharide/colanic/teichoic acid biosynthesis glycosyltransferase
LSLDELPQIFNILQGYEPCGPRPVVRDELEIYGSAAVYYLKSRPGLTGLWQVSGRNDVSYDSRVALIATRRELSLFEDIRIISRPYLRSGYRGCLIAVEPDLSLPLCMSLSPNHSTVLGDMR